MEIDSEMWKEYYSYFDHNQMPFPNSPYAPKTFDGDEAEISNFIAHFGYIAEDAELHGYEKIRYFMHYLSIEQRRIFATFDGYSNYDWNQFLFSIEESYFNVFRSEFREDVVNYAKRSAKTPIHTRKEFIDYHQFFETTTHGVAKAYMSAQDYDILFWYGLHSTTRDMLQQYLRDKVPSYKIGAHSRRQILTAGLRVFPLNAFVTPFGQTSPIPTFSPSSDDVNVLLQQMVKFELQDPEYLVLYAKIHSICPTITEVVKKPIVFDPADEIIPPLTTTVTAPISVYEYECVYIPAPIIGTTIVSSQPISPCQTLDNITITTAAHHQEVGINLDHKEEIVIRDVHNSDLQPISSSFQSSLPTDTKPSQIQSIYDVSTICPTINDERKDDGDSKLVSALEQPFVKVPVPEPVIIYSRSPSESDISTPSDSDHTSTLNIHMTSELHSPDDSVIILPPSNSDIPITIFEPRPIMTQQELLSLPPSIEIKTQNGSNQTTSLSDYSLSKNINVNNLSKPTGIFDEHVQIPSCHNINSSFSFVDDVPGRGPLIIPKRDDTLFNDETPIQYQRLANYQDIETSINQSDFPYVYTVHKYSTTVLILLIIVFLFAIRLLHKLQIIISPAARQYERHSRNASNKSTFIPLPLSISRFNSCRLYYKNAAYSFKNSIIRYG